MRAIAKSGLCLLLISSAVSGPNGWGAEPAAGPAKGPRPPSESAHAMTVPDGFRVTLFASEPDVRQPIAFAIDVRGRLWVAECFSYPAWRQPPTEKDRIVIFEDTDGDGRFDRRKVFWDQGSNVTGLALGFGGVWVCATPNLLFIPDHDGDDTPDAPPVVKLDGWDEKGQHNLFNGLNWGPDGWLYGCNGILSNSRVGKPGTPEGDRTAINCGVWRYHPTRDVFEAFAHGTTNPWGLDFDDHGEAFITNCVIPHLFHVVPGAHFQRMFGSDINPYSFDLLASCADHIHWAGGEWQSSRGGAGKHGEAGGGHAHVGAMIYLGDNWPERYRNSVFMCNLHGKRVNHDVLRRQGSSYVATHGNDFLFANDDWYRGLELKYGPDGGVYLTDWSDIGECHETDGDGAHRENGRIYKITYGDARPVRVDLTRKSSEELAELQTHRNEWYVRNARRLLQERAAQGQPMGRVHSILDRMFNDERSTPRKLRALWALHVTGCTSPRMLRRELRHESPAVRGWAVRLLCEEKHPSAFALDEFARLARSDESPDVRLCLASALQRLPVADRWPIAEGLVGHTEDAGDAYLPLMIWYGLEPLAAADPARALGLALASRIPIVRQYLARRIVLADDRSDATGRPGVDALAHRLKEPADPAITTDLLEGMLQALRGRKGLTAPKDWSAASARLESAGDRGVRERALRLGLLFGDPHAALALGETMDDASAPLAERERAMQSLTEQHPPWLVGRLLKQVDQGALRGPAIRALAAFGDDSIPRALLRNYQRFTTAERADAVNTLAARPAFALALLAAVDDGTVARRDLSVSTARQLLAFGDPEISATLERVWGTLRPTSGEKSALLAKYKARLGQERLATADRSAGRAVFNRVCAQCHRLFDSGGNIGPDLTGSDRANLDYILENVLDPSATVGREFRLTTVATTDGRLISGIVAESSDKTLTVQTVNERVVLARQDVEAVKESTASMMPEGTLEALSENEVRDLVGYLGAKSQVPLPADATDRPSGR